MTTSNGKRGTSEHSAQERSPSAYRPDRWSICEQVEQPVGVDPECDHQDGRYEQCRLEHAAGAHARVGPFLEEHGLYHLEIIVDTHGSAEHSHDGQLRTWYWL